MRVGLAALALLLMATPAAGTIVAAGHNGTILTSGAGTSWATQSMPNGNAYFDVAMHGGVWVAVGDGGSILTSTNAATWTTQASGTAQWLEGVATDGATWIAVGTGGAIVRGPGAGAWWPLSSGTSQHLYALATDGHRWVAVGAAGQVLTSTDQGTTWSTQTLGTPSPKVLNDIAHDGTQWTIVGDAGRIYTSPDGAAWTARTSGTPKNLKSVATDGTTWMAVGDAGTILTSQDATTWQTQTGGTGQLTQVQSCGTRWITTSLGGQVRIQTNATWATVTSQPHQLQAIACSPAPLSCSAPATATIGEPVTTTLAGGAPPYTWNSTGVVNHTRGSSYGTAFTTDGNHTTTVTDRYAQSATCTTTVTAPPPLTCSPADQTVTLYTNGNLTASGGTPPYNWQTANTTTNGTLYLPYLPTGNHTVNLTDSSYYAQTTSCTLRVVAPESLPQASQATRISSPSDEEAAKATTAENLNATQAALNLARQGAFFDAGSTECETENGASEGSCEPTPMAASGPTTSQKPALAPLAAIAHYITTPANIPLLAAGAAGGFAASLLARRGRYFALLLFSRLNREKLLDHPVRACILEHIEAQPGIHFREIVRLCGKGRGTIEHHLAILVQANLIQEVDAQGYKGFIIPSTHPEPNTFLKNRVLKAQRAIQLYDALRERQSARVSDIVQEFGWSWGGTMHHLRRLQRAGLIQLEDTHQDGMRATVPPNEANPIGSDSGN